MIASLIGALRQPLALGGLCVLCALSPCVAQTGDHGTPMIGTWELSNAERDKSCTLTFRLDVAGPGQAVDLDKACVQTFPETRDISAWIIGKDEALRLVDLKGKPVLEFMEVENGLFEPLHPGAKLYFLQTMAAAQGREHTADQMFGDWSLARVAGKPICQVSLLGTAAETDSFALAVKPGCDAQVAGYVLKGWRMDRGLLLLLSGRGDPWRFEEEEPGVWHRIPEGRHPLLFTKSQG
jgi:hypothetical protein